MLTFEDIKKIPEAKESMTPRKRVLSALAGERVDRPPAASVTSLATLEQMKQTGAWFPDVHLDGEKTAALAAANHDILGFDTVVPYFGLMLEASALGTNVKWGKVMPNKDITMPYAPPQDLESFKDPEQVNIPEDFLEKPATRSLLEALSILKERYGDKVAIVGKAMGPWTLAYHLVGTEKTLLMLRSDPGKLHRFMEVFKEITIIFANAQAEAGADLVCIPDHATGDMVAPSVYKDYLHEIHKEMNKKIKSPTVLHCCGYTLDRMQHITNEGFVAYHFESKNNAPNSTKICGDELNLWGNINNPQTLAYGSLDDVVREAVYALQAGVRLVGPECAIPTMVSNDKLRAVVEVAKRFPNMNEMELLKSEHDPAGTPPLKFIE